MRTATIAFVIAAGLSTSALAGGSSGVGAIDWKSDQNTSIFGKALNSFLSNTLVSNSVDYYTALSLAWKYYILATKTWGDTDDAHVKAAYLWGYEVGNPDVVEQVRIALELGQFFYYGIPSQLGLPSDYDPRQYTLENGGLLDSALDIEVSIMGAKDGASGSSANPPSAVEASAMTGLSLIE